MSRTPEKNEKKICVIKKKTVLQLRLKIESF